jgi:hypothetical protein
MAADYLDIVHHLSSNYKFITFKKEYKFGSYKNAHVVNRPSFFLNDLLIKGTYNILNSGKFFHKKEMIDLLSGMDKNTYLDDLTYLSDNTIIQFELHPSNRDFLKINSKWLQQAIKDSPITEANEECPF